MDRHRRAHFQRFAAKPAPALFEARGGFPDKDQCLFSVCWRDGERVRARVDAFNGTTDCMLPWRQRPTAAQRREHQRGSEEHLRKFRFLTFAHTLSVLIVGAPPTASTPNEAVDRRWVLMAHI